MKNIYDWYSEAIVFVGEYGACKTLCKLLINGKGVYTTMFHVQAQWYINMV